MARPHTVGPSVWNGALGRRRMRTALVAAILLGSLPCAAQVTSTAPPEVRAHLQEVARGLPADNVLRKEIEFGVHGTGVRDPWMDLAKDDGVKAVEVEVNFTWHRGVHDLQPVRVMFFSSYDEPLEQIRDNAALEKFERDGLKSMLEQAGLDRARQGAWFESPEHQHPPKRGRVPASTGVLLYDDPWLPLPQVWYGIRDVSWSPLDDAAFMDDEVAVKELLAERRVKQTDLDRALAIAALGDSLAAIHLLLDGGANVNARIKNYGTALNAAIMSDHSRSVDVLLKAGANPNSKNGGYSPLSIAIEHHNGEIAAILKQAGAH